MNDREYKQEKRLQNCLERLSLSGDCCIVCGESDPRVLEAHHLAGKDFRKILVTVCRNCHRKLSDMQKDHPAILLGTPTKTECEGRELLGIADIEELRGAPPRIVELIRQMGERLVERGQPFGGSAQDAEP